MRLLVVDDETVFATVLARGLGRQGYTVDVAPDGVAACEQASVSDYDLILLDLNLPALDGLEVCRRLRQEQPELLILMITARASPDERVNGLDLGADDYLVKPFHFDELCARIRALLRRSQRLREPILAAQDLRLDPASRVAWQGKRRLELTRKEFGVLEYLLRHQGEVVSQEALYEHVWGELNGDNTNTVRVHVNSLRRKLGDAAQPARYIETVIGMGYRLATATEATEPT